MEGFVPWTTPGVADTLRRGRFSPACTRPHYHTWVERGAASFKQNIRKHRLHPMRGKSSSLIGSLSLWLMYILTHRSDGEK